MDHYGVILRKLREINHLTMKQAGARIRREEDEAKRKLAEQAEAEKKLQEAKTVFPEVEIFDPAL